MKTLTTTALLIATSFTATAADEHTAAKAVVAAEAGAIVATNSVATTNPVAAPIVLTVYSILGIADHADYIINHEPIVDCGKDLTAEKLQCLADRETK
ncbi:hypothetical protein [Vibrio sp. WXL210]|uniref:hypothetical protein n=1 Tax=Vibrio sp. WXL210 TaxID=3450709 RepID=UPI003EC6CEB2